MGYYDFFVSEANDGYVFDSDMSSMQTVADRLTALVEAKERRDWNKSFADIRKHYRGKNLKPPKVTSQEGVLQQRLIAPRMEPHDVTRRTGMTESRAGRMYPHPTHLAVWDDAESNVANYRLSTAPITDMYPRQFEVFHLMMIHGNKKGYRSKDKELEFLLNGLDFLTAAKIVGEIEREKYKAAYEAVIDQRSRRTIEWGHIAHPFAQLLGYLVDNAHRYGALTSATRTIFVYISGAGANIKVSVSEPYYIGEENYLRAWACVFSLGCKQKDRFNTPKGENRWIKTGGDSPTPQPSLAAKNSEGKNKRKREDITKQKGHGSSKKRKTVSLSKLPTVDFLDLVVGKEIGIGRNGSLFQVSWKGNEYALKQFDVGKDGIEGFENEIAAYERTEEVWGKLVPKPYFVSETPSGGVKLLGLQLGSSIDDSLVDGNEMWKQWQQAHAVLEHDYGIRHNDAESGRNSILIDDGQGHQQLAIIDFESWNDLFA